MTDFRKYAGWLEVEQWGDQSILIIGYTVDALRRQRKRGFYRGECYVLKIWWIHVIYRSGRMQDIVDTMRGEIGIHSDLGFWGAGWELNTT